MLSLSRTTVESSTELRPPNLLMGYEYLWLLRDLRKPDALLRMRRTGFIPPNSVARTPLRRRLRREISITNWFTTFAWKCWRNDAGGTRSVKLGEGQMGNQGRNHVVKVGGSSFLVWGITTLLQKKIRKVYPVWRSLLPPTDPHQKPT